MSGRIARKGIRVNVGDTTYPGTAVVVRRHARGVLMAATVGVLGLVLFVVTNATQYQWWAPYHWPTVLIVSAIPPLLLGPRQVAVTLAAEAVLWLAAGQLLSEHKTAAIVIWGLMCAGFIALGVWPTLEKQHIVSNRDMWFRAAAAGGVYLGFAIAYAQDALSLRAMGGLHIWFGAIGMLQAVLNCRRILLGPPEAIPPRAFRILSASSEVSNGRSQSGHVANEHAMRDR